ncbi:hypothetical protein [Streptomyces adustus]
MLSVDVAELPDPRCQVIGIVHGDVDGKLRGTAEYPVRAQFVDPAGAL